MTHADRDVVLTLAPHGTPGTVVHQLTPDPVFVGPEGTGATYRCGHCEGILAERIPERMLVDLMLRCFRCGAVNRVPPLPPSAPISQLALVLGEDREYRIRTVDLTDVAVVSRHAFNRWMRRAERTARAFFGPNAGPTLDEGFCSRLISDVRTLLGPVWDEIAAADAKVQSSPTPPPVRHRLAELVEATEDAKRELGTAHPTIDAFMVAELDVVVRLMRHWSRDPVWDSMRRAFVGPDDYVHSVLTLAAATVLISVGNPVALYAADGRAADLRLEFSPLGYAVTEVKVPRALHAPEGPIAAVVAEHIIDRARKKAGTGSRGQLSPERSGLLIVGGYGLSEQHLASLEEGANRVLAGKPRAHLLGIAIVSVGSTLDTSRAGRAVGVAVAVRVAKNPSYAGPDRLGTEATAGPRQPTFFDDWLRHNQDAA